MQDSMVTILYHVAGFATDKQQFLGMFDSVDKAITYALMVRTEFQSVRVTRWQVNNPMPVGMLDRKQSDPAPGRVVVDLCTDAGWFEVLDDAASKSFVVEHMKSLESMESANLVWVSYA